MKRFSRYLPAALVALAMILPLAPEAEARSHVSVGLNFGGPVYASPYYNPYYYPAYYPPYAYAYPRPVYVAPRYAYAPPPGYYVAPPPPVAYYPRW